ACHLSHHPVRSFRDVRSERHSDAQGRVDESQRRRRHAGQGDGIVADDHHGLRQWAQRPGHAPDLYGHQRDHSRRFHAEIEWTVWLQRQRDPDVGLRRHELERTREERELMTATIRWRSVALYLLAWSLPAFATTTTTTLPCCDYTSGAFYNCNNTWCSTSTVTT